MQFDMLLHISHSDPVATKISKFKKSEMADGRKDRQFSTYD